MTEKERHTIEEKMKKAGIRNMGRYFIKMATKGYILQLDLSNVKELVSLLRNATTNLNQIAKRVNGTGNIYETDIKNIQSRVEEIWDQSKDILRKLATID